ncbi:MAG: class I SAM-dependent methyltransferase [Verrucomicrobiota bacterium]
MDGVRGAIPLASEQIDVMLRLLSAQETPIPEFLDIGCGDDILAAAIFGKFPEAEGTLIDFSRPMLKSAADRMASKPLQFYR